MGISDQFNNFLKNLQLTQTQREDVETKRSSVSRALHSAYYGGTYNEATNFLCGSHGKKTAVRPPSDIDLMFIIPYQTYEAFSKRIGNIQSQLLQDVRLTLKSTFPRTEIRADGQVVSIPFDSYKVELAPCVRLTNGSFWICDTNNGGRWKESSPHSEVIRLNESDIRSKGNVRRLIGMIKCWRNFCNVPLKPFWIEILAQEFLSGWEHHDKSTVYFDWMVRDFFAFLISKKNTYVFANGTAEWISLGDDWLSRAQSAYQRAKKACEDGSEYPYLAADEWKKIFDDYFPYPSTTGTTLLTGGLASTLLAKGLLRG